MFSPLTYLAQRSLAGLIAPTVGLRYPQILAALSEGEIPEMVRGLTAAEAANALLLASFASWDGLTAIGPRLHHLLTGPLTAFLWATIPDQEVVPLVSVEYRYLVLPTDQTHAVRDIVLVLLLAALTDGATHLLLTLGRSQEKAPITVTLQSDRPGLARGGDERAQLLAQVQALGWSLQFQQTPTGWIAELTLPAASESAGTSKEEPR